MDARTGATVRTWRWPKLPVRHRDVSADGRSALAVNLGGTELVAWDTRTSRVRFHLAPGLGERFLRAGLVGDGRVITVARDLRRPAVLRHSIWMRGEAGPARTALGSDAERTAVSHDGRKIAERSAEVGGVNFLDTATEKRWRASGRHAKLASGLGLSPDGRSRRARGEDGAVMLWKPQNGQRVEVLRRMHLAVSRRLRRRRARSCTRRAPTEPDRGTSREPAGSARSSAPATA